MRNRYTELICNYRLIKCQHFCVVAKNREMKGTDCRLNLIKLTSVMFHHQQTSNGRDLYQVLLSLVELQKLAYASEVERSPRAILRAHNQSFIFGLRCMKLFSSPKNVAIEVCLGCLFIHLPSIFQKLYVLLGL